jgi:predicted transcriptional regulator of viral defense system
MNIAQLLRTVGAEPIFDSHALLAGRVDAGDVRRQLSRWVRSGHVIRIRRGLYMLGDLYRRRHPHPFLVANLAKRASYVSMQSALQYHGLIPEHVPSITSVTTGRPEVLSTPAGNFIFKHVKKQWFKGYRSVDLGDGQTAFVAGPEKALLDLVYLTPGADSTAWIRELRLQNLRSLDPELLEKLAGESGSAKLRRAAERISRLLRRGEGESS